VGAEEFPLRTPLSVEFVGDGIPLEEIGMELTDESGVRGGLSGNIRSVGASENAGNRDRGGGGVRRGGITSNWSRLGTADGAGDDEGGGGNSSSVGRLRSREPPTLKLFVQESPRLPVGPTSKPLIETI